MRRKPELLAPVGGADALVAAVQNGADAVYLGVGTFNARQTADQFTGETLRDAVRYCRLRGVKVYATLNTIVREDEMAALEKSVADVASAQVDAVLVQDFGVASAIRRMVPGLPLHASTQMAVHNRAGAAFMKKQGFARVVLAREMTLEDIRACAGLGIELEVFVHGALCVSGSGQCLFSSVIGGRSANRGRCAQPCRLGYTLNGVEGCLLSCRDLCAAGLLGALADAGVDSFKLEGRLKRPEYVSLVTRTYRQAIDHPETPVDTEALAQMFNRGGFTRGYLEGVEESKLIFSERPNHMGVPAGRCLKNGCVTADADLIEGDALALRRSGAEDIPVHLAGRAGERLACPAAKRGDTLIRLVSEAQLQAEREARRGERRVTRAGAKARFRVGEPASLTLRAKGVSVTADGPVVEAARSRGTGPERVLAQLGKTGGTPWRLEPIDVDMDDNAFCPAAAVNALRRDALEKLEDACADRPYAIQPAPEAALPDAAAGRPALLVQSADPAILCEALRLGADEALYAPDDLRAPSLASALEQLPRRFSLVLPPIAADRTLETLHAWATAHAERIDSVFLNNVGQFDYDWPGKLCADGWLNLANRRAAEALAAWGCERFCPSPELTAAQIAALGIPTYLTVYGRLTLMNLRHCPLRTVRGDRGPHSACRRCDGCAPVERLDGRTLTDRTGAAFPLKRLASEDGCVVQVENSVPTMLLRRLDRLRGYAGLRLCVDERDDVAALVRLHRLAMQGGDFRGDPDWPRFDSMDTTTGHYFRGVE